MNPKDDGNLYTAEEVDAILDAAQLTNQDEIFRLQAQLRQVETPIDKAKIAGEAMCDLAIHLYEVSTKDCECAAHQRLAKVEAERDQYSLEEIDRRHEIALEDARGRDALKAEMNKWERALVSLTPGGSEFVGSPERCVEVVNHLRGADHKGALRFKAERDALRNAIQDVIAHISETTATTLQILNG